MRGRKPSGPELVQQLEGSAASKKRAEIILRTVAGQLSVTEASALLGITPQRLHVLREEGLQALVDQFEPRPLGRPRKMPASAVALSVEIERLQQELEAARLREEIALLLPGRQPGPATQKKGRRAK
jgi:cytochrome P450